MILVQASGHLKGMTIADAESGAIMFGRTAVGVVSEHAAVATTAVARAVGTRREAAERVPRAALVMERMIFSRAQNALDVLSVTEMGRTPRGRPLALGARIDAAGCAAESRRSHTRITRAHV